MIGARALSVAWNRLLTDLKVVRIRFCQKKTLKLKAFHFMSSIVVIHYANDVATYKSHKIVS